MAVNQPGKSKSNYSNAPASNIRYVPVLSDLFTSWPQHETDSTGKPTGKIVDSATGKPGWSGKLSRTWTKFFQEPPAPAPIIGWWMPGVLANATGLPALTCGRPGNVSEVAVVVVASDPSINLEFDILQNGNSIFAVTGLGAQTPKIAKNTAAGTPLTFSALATQPLAIAQGDVFTFNMIAGSALWSFSAQLHNAIPSAQ